MWKINYCDLVSQFDCDMMDMMADVPPKEPEVEPRGQFWEWYS